MKLKEKMQAICLRKTGKSYSEIIKILNVSKSSLSLWLREIELSAEQILTLKGRQRSGHGGGLANKRKRIKRTKEIITVAEKEAQELFLKPMFLPGLMLYWAEGDKSEVFEEVKFSNSDPLMIKFMMRWFREIGKVPEYKFRIAIHIHELHCKKDIEKYWSEITGIPLQQFVKTQIKPTSLGHRRNILYNGTCSIIVHNRDLFRRIKGWKNAFLSEFSLINNVPVA